jgi:hypothetical protein
VKYCLSAQADSDSTGRILYSPMEYAIRITMSAGRSRSLIIE